MSPAASPPAAPPPPAALPDSLEGALAQLDPARRWKFEQELARAKQGEIWDIGPVPAWVEPLPPSPRRDTAAPFVLMETQNRLEGATSSQYVHYIYRVQNEQDLRRFSKLAIDFHPGVRRPVLHALNVRRGEAIIPQLKRALIRFVPEERRVEAPERGRPAIHLARDARLELAVVGLQLGDRVELAYTLHTSEDTRLMGRSSVALHLEMPLAAERLRHRVIAPADAPPLAMRQVGDAGAPSVRTRGAWKEYVWERRDVPARVAPVVEGFAPAREQAFIEISNFASWDEVARLVRPMFHRGEHAPELTELAASIRARHPEPAAQALAALRHVQDNITYSAAQMGTWTHEPKPLATILKEGFADCKGKTLILLTLLAELGVPADAVLVRAEGLAADVLPSPWPMNHVIVALRIDGHEVFVDPSRPAERGDLGHLSGYPFLRGLVLAPGRGLVDIPSRCDESRPQLVGTARYRVGPPGQGTELHWQVESNGGGADDARAIYRDEPLSAMQERMQVAFSEVYGAVVDVIDIKRWDDEPVNTHHADSWLRFGDIWRREPDGSAVAVFSPLYLIREVDSLATEPTMVRELKWCDHHKVTTILDLERAAEVVGESFSVEAPGLALTHDITTVSSSRDTTQVTVIDVLRICSHDVVDGDVVSAKLRGASERLRVGLRVVGDGSP